MDNRLPDELYNETCSVLFNCHRIIRFTNSSDDVWPPIKYRAYIDRNVMSLMKWKNKDENIAEISRQMQPILENWIGGDIPLNYSV